LAHAPNVEPGALPLRGFDPSHPKHAIRVPLQVKKTRLREMLTLRVLENDPAGKSA
jgi:hypothetical protein